MSNPTLDKQKASGQPADVLLVLDNEKKKVQAVKNITKDGKMETIDANKKNQNQFLRVDKHGDLFSNFLSNFMSQLKNPTQFRFLTVAEDLVLKIASELQKEFRNPTKEGQKKLADIEVNFSEVKNNKQENRNTMETTNAPQETGEYRYKPEQLDWDTLSKLGLSKERLEEKNMLDPLLKGYKTNGLISVKVEMDAAFTYLDARLSLRENEQGKVQMAIHSVRKEPELNFPFLGHEFTKEDKENLLKTGNMGRVVDLTNRAGETFPFIISVDRLTNELVPLRADKIKIPDEIKGVKLNDDQKHTLMEGKPLHLENMISNKGEPFNANVQFNADKRYVEFLFDRGNRNRQEQSTTMEAPRTIRGKELNEEQYQKFNSGQTIYLTDLKDKQGKEYKGYLTFDKDSGKTGFSFTNPNTMKDKVQPAEGNKTQTTVNSDGKTNEGTKNVNEPLKPGQSTPETTQQQEQQQAPTRSTRPKL